MKQLKNNKMKKLSETNYRYNNEALLRLAKIYLAKTQTTFNSFYCVGTSSGTITIQGHIEDNTKLLLQVLKCDNKEVEENMVTVKIGKYLRIVLTERGY